MIEIKPSTREFFINNIANWLPEFAFPNIKLLSMEHEGKIGFFVDTDNTKFYIRDTNTKEFLVTITLPR